MDLKCSFWSEDLPCGGQGVGSRICPLLSCTRDIELHLSSLGLGSKRSTTGSKISEVDLILNRAGKFAVCGDEKGAMTVCPRHRKSLTTDWLGRKRTTCCYPNHKGERKGNAQTGRNYHKKFLTCLTLLFPSVQVSSVSGYLLYGRLI